MSCCVFAQQETNPFDIKGRTTSSNIEYDEIVQVVQDSIVQDSISFDHSTDTLATANEAISELSEIQGQSNNPFDVRKKVSTSNTLEAPVTAEPKTKTSIYIDEEDEKIIPAVPKQNKSKSKAFVFWVLLFLIVVLASVINIKRNSFSNLYRSISNENYLRLIQREENNGLSPLFLILNFIFYINGGLFIYLTFHHFGFNVGFTFFIGAVVVLFVIYFIRIISMALLAYIFPITKEAKQYNFTILLYNNFIGIILIVINLLVAFGPNFFSNLFIYLGFILVAMFYLLRVFRGLLNSISYINQNFFHFFLYLCTFEIATVFILIKVVQNWAI